QRHDLELERRQDAVGFGVGVAGHEARGPAAVLVGQREIRFLQELRRLAPDLEPARQHGLALAVLDHDLQRRRVPARPAGREGLGEPRPLGPGRDRLDAPADVRLRRARVLGARGRRDEQGDERGRGPPSHRVCILRARRANRSRKGRTNEPWVSISTASRPSFEKSWRRSSASARIAALSCAGKRGSLVPTSTVSPLSRSSNVARPTSGSSLSRGSTRTTGTMSCFAEASASARSYPWAKKSLTMKAMLRRRLTPTSASSPAL